MTLGLSMLCVFALRKYFRFEDECEECVKDMLKKKWHFDLWMGGYGINERHDGGGRCRAGPAFHLHRGPHAAL